MFIVPNSTLLRNCNSFDSVLEAAATANNAGRDVALQKTYQDPIGNVEGFIATIAFNQDLKGITLDNVSDFTDAALRVRARRTSSFVRRLNSTAASLVSSEGQIGLYKSTKRAEARQRARIKAFVKKWLRQMEGELAELGGCNYYCDGALHLFCVAGSALVYDSENHRVYALFDSNPCKGVRDDLRMVGFTRGGTNQLWYIDTPAMNSTRFMEMVNSFYAGIRSAYHAEALAFNRKVRTISNATAA